MAPNLRYSGDPRRPSEAKAYSPEHFSPEDFPPDGFVLLGLSLGLAALMLRFKWAVIGSFICTLLAVANSRWSDNETKQIVSTLCVVGFSIFQMYVDLPQPNKQSTGGSTTTS